MESLPIWRSLQLQAPGSGFPVWQHILRYQTHCLTSRICVFVEAPGGSDFPPLCNSDSISIDFISKPFHDFFSSECLPWLKWQAIDCKPSLRRRKKEPLPFSTYFRPATHHSFWAPGVICWDFLFPLYSDSSSLSWIPLLGTVRLIGKKHLWGKGPVFALGWKSDTINENSNWALWAWTGMKHNSRSMFVILMVPIRRLWRALCHVHSSIFSSFFFKPISSFYSITYFPLSSRKEKRVKWDVLQTDFRTHLLVRLQN